MPILTLMTPYDTLLDLAQTRRSAYAFSDAPVTDDELANLMEAARHTPSSFNEQPWRLVIARRGEVAHEVIAGALKGRNPEWAPRAPVLGLSLASSMFARNGRPNRHAWHDTGAFMMALSLAAASLGMSMHQMAGVDATTAADALGVPDGFEPVAAFALGHLPDERGAGLSDEMAVRDRADRGRRPIEETAYGPLWGQPRV